MHPRAQSRQTSSRIDPQWSWHSCSAFRNGLPRRILHLFGVAPPTDAARRSGFCGGRLLWIGRHGRERKFLAVMRRLAIFAIVLTGCSANRRPPSPDDLYHNAETLLRQGRLKQALAAADSGLRVEPSWRFRLLKVEALLSSGQAREAAQALDSAALPDSPELRARWLMHRGHALICSPITRARRPRSTRRRRWPSR